MLTLALTNFRAHQNALFNFTGKDLIVGKNGAGKTSLLEAIYYLNYTKSYRSNYDLDLIIWGEDFFRLEGKFKNSDLMAAYSKKNRTKQLSVNKNKLQASKFIGNIPLVLFAPELIEIIIGSPRNRRQYVDMVIGGIDPTHIDNLNLYRHLLKQRNSALQNIGDYTEIAPWDMQLISIGKQIAQKREAFILFISEFLNDYYSKASQGTDSQKVKAIYRPTIKSTDDWQSILQNSFQKDKILGLTSLGPHRDDILFLISGRRLATTASRGEQRTFLLALKRAEIDFLQTKLKNQRPILLLDDIFSELDVERSNSLFELMDNYPSITTCTDAAVLNDKIKNSFNILKI